MTRIAEVLDGVEELVGRSGLVIQRVNSAELLNEVLRLRYEVYCNECKFIKAEDCISKIESDKFDPRSIHFSSSDRHGVIGTMRLVLDSPAGFPFENYCRGKLYNGSAISFRKDAAEISRLMISKRHMHRSPEADGASSETIGSQSREGRELFVLRHKPIALGMYRSMYIETKARGIKYWYALMERPLQVLLRRYGFEFTRIGDDIELYGKVAPYMASVEKIEETLREHFPLFIKRYCYTSV